MAEKRVADDSKFAKDVIHRLTADTDLPKGTPKMPLTELAQCKGLAFTSVHKAGAVLTVEHGTGFVVAKLPGRGGRQSWAWSAPLFIKLFSGGIGLSLGYNKIESVIVLDTPEAVQGFAKTQVTLDTDVGAALGSKLSAHLPVTDANFSDFKLSDKTFTYSICEGLAIDFSLQGMGYKVDKDANEAVYGKDAKPEAILDGSVAPPAGFTDLYDELNRALLSYYAAAAAEAVAKEAEAGSSEGVAAVTVEVAELQVEDTAPAAAKGEEKAAAEEEDTAAEAHKLVAEAVADVEAADEAPKEGA